MEAGSGVLVDPASYPKGNSPFIPGFGRNAMINSSLLLRSNSQRVLLDIPGGAIGADAGFLGPRPPMCALYPPPAPTYSSLPNLNLLQQQHPPLLPFPLAKSSSLPSPTSLAKPTRRTNRAVTARSLNKEEKKLTKSPAKPRRGTQTGGTKTKKELHPAVNFPSKHKLHPEEDDEADGVYSLSPPPSSLPMPRFFALRTKAPSSPSPRIAETFRGDPTKADAAGASDDLRRLLRL